jgi:hypothetical protein
MCQLDILASGVICILLVCLHHILAFEFIPQRADLLAKLLVALVQGPEVTIPCAGLETLEVQGRCPVFNRAQISILVIDLFFHRVHGFIQ